MRWDGRVSAEGSTGSSISGAHTECENFHMLSSDPYTHTYKISKCKKIRNSLQVLGGGSNCEEVREEMFPVWKVLVRFGTRMRYAL